VAEGPAGPTVALVPSEGMGRGDDELGTILIRAFLHTLNEVEPLPATMIFINAGVKLTVDGSPVLEDLQALERRRVNMLACSTCLGHFEFEGEGGHWGDSQRVHYRRDSARTRKGGCLIGGWCGRLGL